MKTEIDSKTAELESKQIGCNNLQIDLETTQEMVEPLNAEHARPQDRDDLK